ncbi:hypothetical protein J2X48_001423 [Bosea sp. BE271]|uniref:MBL fold metallo-hydrolase n=1 Tax=Bosea TaxID=85413 RepID=UPI0028675D62|nr:MULTISPECIES: MBL fold metallo-hydrolase [Bosea]MDR6827697.1 hypothetical protein [Bosea robiniae]MDR6894609.1 hypothetical protein [Bosea sp. BE109]MDR7137803.1 hypothetical protein [Bosea sp. BE168]MDR7174502.1 hypothetical protein [Bosea sp. BE271]
MELEVLPAAKGDCLLLHHEWEGKARLILIDGGPAGIYPKHLKPRLLQLRKERIASGVLDEDAALPIDLVIISHIDDDHINGILALMRDVADQREPAPFKIGRLWHNSFQSLLAVESASVANLTQAGQSLTAGLATELAASLNEEADDDAHDVHEVLASVKQGFDVLALAKQLKIPVNPEFSQKAIEASNGKPLTIDGLKITVIGPLKSELTELRELFAEWLKKKRSGAAETASLLASFSDKSVANLASIVLLVEQKGEKYLLTGDARGDKFMQAAKDLKLLDKSGKLPVSIFKVPHHGSDRNLTADCFRQFPAPYYVISGNGEHGNPERASFEFLVEALAGTEATVELTYTPAQIDKERELEHNKKHSNKFSAAKDGIVSFLHSQKNIKLKLPENHN